MARKKIAPGGEPSVPEAARPVYDTVVALTDAFCREHLNDEYGTLCRKLGGALARKRPSPLLSGKPTAWVTGDEVYGGDGGLRRWLESERRAYVLAVRSNQYAWAGLQQSTVAALAKALPENDQDESWRINRGR